VKRHVHSPFEDSLRPSPGPWKIDLKPPFDDDPGGRQSRTGGPDSVTLR
jgi:hypothetical protein